ncbi:hypothetical protein ACHQM5_005033 [Ranunculus cassubicifolius]
MALNSLALFSLLLISLSINAASAHELQKLKPTVQKPIETYKSVGVQGIIYCKSGTKVLPLQGAVARITCTAKNKNGYESDPFTVLSKPTDKKGYFLARLPISSTVFKCKAFLHSSPCKTCNVATDINQGLSGSLVYSSYYHILHDNKMKLYSVGPFAYSSAKIKIVEEGY